MPVPVFESTFSFPDPLRSFERVVPAGSMHPNELKDILCWLGTARGFRTKFEDDLLLDGFCKAPCGSDLQSVNVHDRKLTPRQAALTPT